MVSSINDDKYTNDPLKKERKTKNKGTKTTIPNVMVMSCPIINALFLPSPHPHYDTRLSCQTSRAHGVSRGSCAADDDDRVIWTMAMAFRSIIFHFLFTFFFHSVGSLCLFPFFSTFFFLENFLLMYLLDRDSKKDPFLPLSVS